MKNVLKYLKNIKEYLILFLRTYITLPVISFAASIHSPVTLSLLDFNSELSFSY